MTDTQTKFAGIIIRTKDTDSKAFIGMVNTALDTIDGKPAGKLLLSTIASQVAKAKFGFTVCIMPKESIKKSAGPLIRWRTYQVGSVTKASNESDASNGTGVISSLKWDPKSKETPDGARPPFIALAHELIHCMHNLLGTSHLIGGASQLKLDEMRCTGLQGYEQEPVSENRIRREHNIPLRSSYHGKCSKAEGQPDASKF